jgi:acetylornithine/succinyldiaminopimelate/putrescine aminotransferase
MEDAAVYFAASGSDAVEVALKTAVLASGRPGVLAFSGRLPRPDASARSPPVDGRVPHALRRHLHAHVEHCPSARGERDRGRLARGTFGCVIVEPIQGRAGVVLPPPGWLAELATLARRHGALLVVDEILTGGGRTGPFFACTADEVAPDLLCCGKALAAVSRSPPCSAAASCSTTGQPTGEALHTATFLAHPLACAAALATLRVLDHPDFPRPARPISQRRSRRASKSSLHCPPCAPCAAAACCGASSCMRTRSAGGRRVGAAARSAPACCASPPASAARCSSSCRRPCSRAAKLAVAIAGLRRTGGGRALRFRRSWGTPSRGGSSWT